MPSEFDIKDPNVDIETLISQRAKRHESINIIGDGTVSYDRSINGDEVLDRAINFYTNRFLRDNT